MTWQTWVITLTWAITKIVAVYVIYEPLNFKFKRIYIISLYVSISTLLYAARAYVFIYMPFIPIDIIYFGFIVPVHSFIFFRLTCRDKNSIIILFIILILALGVLGHLLAFIIFYLITGEYVLFDFVGDESLFGGLIAMFSEIVLYFLFLIIWKQWYSGKVHSNIPNIKAFLVIVGGQLIYNMSQMFTMLSEQTEVNPWTSIGMIVMIIGNLAILQILLTNSKKQEVEDNFRDLQHLRELEQIHYTAIEARRQELAKIRHDFNNQLTAAHQLIDTSKSQQAGKLLGELKQSLDATTEQVYCENAIVNAVLTEKQKECDGAEIILETDIILPEDCGISKLHLCSVFTNLLDNAIRACKNVPVRQRRIELRTVFKGDYLHIKCVNSVGDYIDKELKRTGYGKVILSDIAGYYGGNFTADKDKIDNTYVAMISLLCRTE